MLALFEATPGFLARAMESPIFRKGRSISMTAHDDREHLCEIDQTAEPILADGQLKPVTEHPIFARAPVFLLTGRPISADDLRKACSARRR